MKIGIIDYQAGNLQSVKNAFLSIGTEVLTVSKPEHFSEITHLVLPGQGEFKDCASKLKQSGLFEQIKQWLAQDRPFLGICVGYQLLFEGSEENPDTKGLEIFKGKCVKFKSETLKIPHMGWNAVHQTTPEHPIWNGISDGSYFYYVHSYYPICEEAAFVACESDYTQNFHSAVMKGNLLATQFHPEKSQHAGIQLLKNFTHINS